MSFYFLFGKIAELGGYNGISDIPPFPIGTGSASSPHAIYPLIWIALGLAILLCDNLLDSRLGRAMRALRGGSEMVESFGISVFRTRLAVFVIAGLLAGLSGWLYAHMQRFVSPSPFEIRPGAEYLLMAVTGGSGQVVGAVVGAGAVLGIKTVLQDVFPLFVANSGQLETVAFGVLFILLLQHARDGVAPLLARMLSAPALPISESLSSDRLPRRPQRPQGEQLLRVEGVAKRFGGLTAVKEMQFSLATGEILGLIGPNGAGKTTMFNLITGSQKPDSGQILFCGEDIVGLPSHSIAARGIARTFQHVRLRPRTTLVDNVALGAFRRGRAGYVACALHLDRREEARVRNEALRQLERVGLKDKAREFAGNLPLGQQRLLEIARALAADPLLVILDEPAAGLRKMEKQALAGLLREIRAEGTTILLVEHDMDFVMGLVDRLVVMDFGQKLAEGAPGEVQADAQVQKAYLGASA
jgi:branched-chain amino acid transport system permease protein